MTRADIALPPAHASAPPATRSARAVGQSPPKRAWGMPGARCTRSRACRKVTCALVTTDTPETPGIPARNGFNGFLRALPGDRAFLSPSPMDCSTDLTPASGRQDHTTSPSAGQHIRQSAAHVHRIPPRVRDDREPPLRWDETARNIEVIWVSGEAENLGRGDAPLGKLRALSKTLIKRVHIRSAAERGIPLSKLPPTHTDYQGVWDRSGTAGSFFMMKIFDVIAVGF
jgi:hypothetical protein